MSKDSSCKCYKKTKGRQQKEARENVSKTFCRRKQTI